MGLTRFTGPVYGAKAALYTYGPYNDVHSTGASSGLLSDGSTGVAPVSAVTVPLGEDWMITEVYLTASTCSSLAAGHKVSVKVEGGSTVGITRVDGYAGQTTNAQTLISFTNAVGSTTWSTSGVVTAAGGEYEGAWCPAGSSIRFVSSGVTRMGGVQITLRGYTRFVNSLRSEG